MQVIQCMATWLLLPAVSACGGFFCEPQQPVLQAGESIAFGVEQLADDQVEVTMAIQIKYEGPAEAFGWILPVPAVPELEVGSDLLFSALFQATRPTYSWTIDNSQSNCDPKLLDDTFDFCAEFGGGFNEQAPIPGEEEADSATVLDEGTVGPFNFVTLEAAEGRPESVFEWLQENGYDQPEDAAPLITFYATEMNMKFVALQLKKESSSGEIRPIILKYTMSGVNLATHPVACVPLQLTAIAATPAMPIQVYTLAPNRGVPQNFVQATMDLRYLDWLNCAPGRGAGFGSNQNCLLNDAYRLFRLAAQAVEGHAFTTEFAGSTAIAQDIIALTGINLSELEKTLDPYLFLVALDKASVPANALIHTIIERHIPNRYLEVDLLPQLCLGLANVYTPGANAWQMNACAEFIDFPSAFDPVALSQDLQAEIFQPAQDAQDWVDTYPYLTRMYTQLDPSEMNKDPMFAFYGDTVDVSNQIAVTGVPVCDADTQLGPVGLDIFWEDAPSEALEAPLFVEATLDCGRWFRGGTGPILGEELNPAFSFSGYYRPQGQVNGGSNTEILLRDPTTGQFSPTELNALIRALEADIPDSNPTSPISPTTPTSPTSPTMPTSSPETITGQNPGSGTVSLATTFWVLDTTCICMGLMGTMWL